MMLDKELYRQALSWYRQWNEAETRARIEEARQLSSVEAWRRFVDLVEFCWRISPEQTELQRREKLSAVDRYYERLQRFETWRKRRGKAA